VSGERLTRQEAFSLVGRAVAALTSGERAVPASRVRQQAFELLGRDSESLSERNFIRILKDAHDADVIDLRRRGDDYDVAMAAQAAPVAEQLNRAAAAMSPPPRPSAPPPTPRGMGPRGAGARGRGTAGRAAEPPPDLLLLGVVEEVTPPGPPPTTITASLSPASDRDVNEVEAPVEIIEDRGAPKRGRGAKKKAPAKKSAAKAPRATEPEAVANDVPNSAAPARSGKPRRSRGKKTATPAAVEG
jgi:hypothetical protein